MFQYNAERTAQAAAHLIRRAGGRINYMKLIKLLYMADRGSLARWGQPITGDRFVSMPHGPVLTRVYDQITTGPDPAVSLAPWFRLIEREGYDARNVSDDPATDELSRREVALLDSVFDEFRDMDQWQMRDYCHAELPEWQDPQGSSYPIPFERVLQVLGKSAEEIREAHEEAAFMDFAREALGAE